MQLPKTMVGALRKGAGMLCGATALFALSACQTSAQAPWTPKKAPLMTRWAKTVDPKMPLPEYPRPQLVRSEWLNLNGLWEYQPGTEGQNTPTGKTLASQILVPYPVESALSGVMEHHDRIWYRRNVTLPAKWSGKQIKLNFGAVDYESEVFVNGKSVGVHQGGYVPFSYDITPYLTSGGPQEIIVRVFDPTDLGGQPRGKQTLNPGGIMYTPTTGIWQTVWLEPVAKNSIDSLHMIPDIDAKTIRLTVNAPQATSATQAVVKIKDGGRVVKTVTVAPNAETVIAIDNPKLWSPNSPFLYDVEVSLTDNKTETDKLTSYFGMRKISLQKVGQFQKIFLNNEFVFQLGPLDQGFWPDGLYTPPTEEALKADITSMKNYGFNMVRKHIKVEPARWYYWTDKMGLLVWQDMPSENSYTDKPQPLDKAGYITQLNDVIKTHWNAPSIVMWVIFNENQGRHDTGKLVDMAKALDPSRLTNRDSGEGFEKDDNEGTISDVDDVHSYPPPNFPPPSPTQALVCGEYGGIGYPIIGHTWKPGGWGYTSVTSALDLEETYADYANRLKTFRDKNGLSAAVYTQLTDVEIEINGLMTYDRLPKSDPKEIARANRFEYALPTFAPLVPTSEGMAQTWKYTTTAPPTEWRTVTFDDSKWQTGTGGFGTDIPGAPRVGTAWTTSDIWLRRTFNPVNLTPAQIAQLVVRDLHDEDVEVYINGVLAYQSAGYLTSYETKALTADGKKAIVPNAQNTIAVHCHQTQGGQYIDVGLGLRVPPTGKK